MNKKNTAVEFLLSLTDKWLSPKQWQKLVEEAKKLEQIQIEQAFIDGVESGNLLDATNYYNEVYKGGKK